MKTSLSDRRSGRLAGQVALVTGAASGIGRAICERFLAEGARIVAFDRDRESLAECAMAWKKSARTICGDVRAADDARRAAAAAVETFGSLDILVANAGIFDMWRPLSAYDEKAFDAAFEEIFATNVKGACLSVLPALEALRRARGSIIFTVSTAGFHAGGGGVLYAMSKHAQVGLVRQLAYELAPEVRVNGVAPGPTRTSLECAASIPARTRSLDQVGLDAAGADLPLGFTQEPEDHAALFVLLASRRESGAMTGEVLMSDGGVGVRGLRQMPRHGPG